MNVRSHYTLSLYQLYLFICTIAQTQAKQLIHFLADNIILAKSVITTKILVECSVAKMSDENVFKFVVLLEEHTDVLLKSQTTLSKNKKNTAVALIIPKWEEISKSKLSQASLFKKINNLKTRAKSALRSGKSLSEWQAKLLKIIVSSVKHPPYDEIIFIQQTFFIAK